MNRRKSNTIKTKPSITLTGLVDVTVIGLAVATLLGFMGMFYWGFDLLSHFRVQYFQISLVLLFIALWMRLRIRAVALALIATINYAFVLPLYFGKPEPPKEKPVRAMLMNINAGNGNTDEVLSAIEQFSPDILMLEEVTPKWAHDLEVLNTTFPYRIAEPQDGCFGMMLLSKYPLEHGEVVQIGKTGLPSILAEAHLPHGVISIIGTHPMPPMGSNGSRLRNLQLIELPYTVMNEKHPVLLIGDLNVTPFSYWFNRVISESGLKNSMKGFGFQPSWPSNNRFLRIPLDHMLHSPEIAIHNRMVGEDVGSDHFPVIVDFSIR